jgi:hypothetical protein
MNWKEGAVQNFNVIIIIAWRAEENRETSPEYHRSPDLDLNKLSE